jgi:signal recognition particle subunit SRP54
MKKRIAKGSGTTVNEVNKLINQFSRVKKQIDQLGALNRSGSLNEENLEKMMNNVQSKMDDPRLQQQMKELQARNKKYRF